MSRHPCCRREVQQLSGTFTYVKHLCHGKLATLSAHAQASPTGRHLPRLHALWQLHHLVRLKHEVAHLHSCGVSASLLAAPPATRPQAKGGATIRSQAVRTACHWHTPLTTSHRLRTVLRFAARAPVTCVQQPAMKPHASGIPCRQTHLVFAQNGCRALLTALRAVPLECFQRFQPANTRRVQGSCSVQAMEHSRTC